MILYLHDGLRCSLCEERFRGDQLLIQMPAKRVYCVLDANPVEVTICADCAVFSEEH